MSKSVYTPEMVEIMTASQPLNAEVCAELSATFGNGITSRSVIAKAKSLGLDYIVKAKPARKKRQRPKWIWSMRLRKQLTLMLDRLTVWSKPQQVPCLHC